MKTITRLGAIAILSFIFFSCKKDVLVTTEPDPVAAPNITSKIYQTINQPATMSLGTAQAILHDGDVVTIYVPYGVYRDDIISSELTMTDATTSDVINTYTLLPSTDAAASQLTIPDELRDVPFMFATFTIDNSFDGRTITIGSNIVGNKTASQDVISNAFVAEP